MSVSKWAYTPKVCDGGGCPGDCDLCNKPRDMEDDMSDYPYEAIVFLGDKDEIVEYTGDEVVRCKECRNWENGRCYLLRDVTVEVRDNDYCSYGERAEE